ncbi:hypothetical protein LCGC14_1755250, partial [marine sediment metagenome]
MSTNQRFALSKAHDDLNKGYEDGFSGSNESHPNT